MKKSYFTFLALFLCFGAFAQLPNGSVAPDFTATDINGKTWNLYDILDSGRPVIMDVSATWCGPCWSYHNSGALENLYHDHGPEGDNTLMVFFVEGDNQTNTNCLYGSAGCVGGTQGNWVAGTPYPIIDDASIANAYNTSYFPTVFTIFPDDKTLVESRPVSQTVHEGIYTPRIGDIAPNAVSINSFDVQTISNQICFDQNADISLSFRNMGTTALTSLKAELIWNGTVLQTIDWTGDAAVFDDVTLDFDSQVITETGNLVVALSEPNGDASAPVKEFTKEFTPPISAYTSDVLNMNFLTDNGGAYLYWAMLDEAGNIVMDGGNKAVGLDGGGQYAGVPAPTYPTAYGNFKNLNIQLPMPSNGECFSIVVVDGEGNGFSGPGRYRLSNPGGSYFFSMTEPFTDRIGHTFGEQVVSTSTLEAVQSITTFPNPASDFVNIDFDLAEAADLSVEISNAIGQIVSTQASGNYGSGKHQVQINTSALPMGMYNVAIRSNDGGLTVRQFVIAR